MSSPFSLPVTLDGAVRKKDDSLSLRFVTTFEITTEDYMQVDRMRNQTGWLLFKPNPIEIADIPKEPAPEREGKSQSKRLYNTLFVYWKQNHPDANDAEFPAWYNVTMEHIINQFKDKLDD